MPDDPTPQRRRGAALEHALLEAAWAELAEKGYDDLTFESVAARAETSRAVLYRRWSSKPELAIAAIGHAGFRLRTQPPDTGSLRGDMIDLIRTINHDRASVVMVTMGRLGAFFTETGTTFAELRETYLTGRETAMTKILDRAVERGEADPAKLTPRVRSVASDLYRHELLMTHKPVPDKVIEEIIDEVFLPLVR